MINVKRRLRGAATLAGAVVIAAFTAPSLYAVGNNMQGSCINDPGRGGLVWGTSSEVTTYSGPYTVFKKPDIYRIPVTSGSGSDGTSDDSDDGADTGNPMERLTESGTIFGTDGKLYEYYYVRGVEPRRVVTPHKVEKSKGLWVDEPIEKIVWEPVLIRVLRPAGTNEKEASAAQKARDAANAPKPCAPLSQSPEPCEPLGAAERQTYDAAASAPSLPNQNGAVPPAEGSSLTPPAEGSPTESKTSLSGKDSYGSVRVVTPSNTSGPAQQRKTVLVLPEELRAQQEAAQKKAAAAAAANAKKNPAQTQTKAQSQTPTQSQTRRINQTSSQTEEIEYPTSLYQYRPLEY